MESKNEYQKNEAMGGSDNKSIPKEEEDVQFENPSVDPGFEKGDELEGLEDERDGDIDSNTNISEMQNDKENDALNYKNDREHGAYNPKNI
ncbi:hypothetical protein [Pedobacter sp. L105]|uniref:hypothetical protein n=1 Tax=Pedobacter sp. L105 TaxID=1641871 RepID=UPI00131C1C2A|nr:hypothetical protein [Pedobacter sp. L105]